MNPNSNLLKFLKICLTCIFSGIMLLSAAVQFNDPDPLPWISIYLASFIIGIVYFVKPFRLYIPAAVLIIAMIWSASLIAELKASPDSLNWSDVFGASAMKNNSVELVREIGGLWLVAIWMVLTSAMVKIGGNREG